MTQIGLARVFNTTIIILMPMGSRLASDILHTYIYIHTYNIYIHAIYTYIHTVYTYIYHIYILYTHTYHIYIFMHTYIYKIMPIYGLFDLYNP